MKKVVVTCLGVFLYFIGNASNENNELIDGFIFGTPKIKSMSKLTFSPNGILFLGDSKGASIYAFDFKDNKKSTNLKPIFIKNIDQKIGNLLGKKREDILIHDLVVNPLSQNIYMTVSYGGENSLSQDTFDPNYVNDATLLMKIDTKGVMSEVSLENVYYSQLKLKNVFSSSEKYSSGKSKNIFTVRYLFYDNGKLYISGLSNEEFSSTFRIANFPFTQGHTTTGVEFYHGAHGKYETSSPINTFIKYNINDKDYLLGAYSCTPMITIPLSDLKDGKEIRAKTVAEIGPGNYPFDIKIYNKKGREYILIANNKRGLIKIKPSDIAAQKKSIDRPTSRAGVAYETLVNGSHLRQLDNLNKDYMVLLKKSTVGYDLESLAVSNL